MGCAESQSVGIDSRSKMSPMRNNNKIALYWGPLSQPSRALKAFLVDSGIKHEDHELNMLAGEGKSPKVLALNPAGTLPFITFNGHVMVETVAILRFLACMYREGAGKFYPEDLMQRYEINKWCDFYTDSFRPAFIMHISTIFMKGDRPIDHRDEFILDRASMMQGKVLNKLQDKLAEGTKFVNGNCLSIADYVIFCEMQDCKYIGVDLTAYPGLVKYEADVMAASPGIKNIHKAGGKWATNDVAAA